mmetsp:Transcript_4781/g.8215  ORF Transcript_4781/g.8215 Transcript_4781/m.8215 type:complete len:274 (+) Transcript_4781:174-995(+)
MVKHHGGVPAQLLNARCPILLRVQCGFDEAERGRAVANHLTAPDYGLLLEVFERHDGVDEPHLQRLLGVVEAAHEPHLLRLLGPNQPRHHRAAVPSVEATHLRPRLPKHSIIRGDGEVAHHVQDVPPPDGVPRHHAHHRLRHPADLNLQVENIQARCAICAHIAARPAHRLIAAAAESEVAGTCQNDGPDGAVIARVLKAPGHLLDCERSERITALRAVDCDLRDPLRSLLVDDVLQLALWNLCVDPHSGLSRHFSMHPSVASGPSGRGGICG